MRKSVLQPCELLKEKLFELTAIVDAFQQKKYNALEDWMQWIRTTEDILKQYNFTESAELAGIRSTLIYSDDISNKNKKKIKYQKAIKTIDRAQEIVIIKQKTLEEKTETVRALVKQILIPAKEAGLVNYDPNLDFTVFLESLITQLKNNPQVAPAVNNAIATIGKYDLMRIMAEEVELT